MENESKNKLSIPLAIVVAGLLIAGAVYLSGSKAQDTAVVAGNQVKNDTQTATASIALRGITVTDHSLGNPEADIAMVEFSDTECPFCKNFHNTLKSIIADYGSSGKVSWIYRHFPLIQLHPKAPKEAESTECVNDLGGNSAFWKYLDSIFEVTPSNNGLDEAQLPILAKKAGVDQKAFETCLSSGKNKDKVDTDYNEALTAGGRGTPFTILILKKKMDDDKNATITTLASQFPPDTITISDDGTKIAISGALPLDLMKSIIDTLLK